MIDLHTHSTCSDGSVTPEGVVERAAGAGCSALALTDHDTLAGLAGAASRAAELGIRLVRGCEVSCADQGTLHMLCYFVPEGESPLSRALAGLREDRTRRNEEMAERLVELGLPLTYEEVLEEAGGEGVGRPHFAAVLVRNGAAGSVQEAFDRFLAKGQPGYLPKAQLGAGAVIGLAADSGAVAVLAHPLSLGLEPGPLGTRLAELAGEGLVGMECHYGRYDPATRERLVALAEDHGLVATGGSDYHGRYKPDLEVGTGVGDLEVPDRALESLEGRRPA